MRHSNQQIQLVHNSRGRKAAIAAADVTPPDVESTHGYLVCSLHGGLIGLDIARIRQISTVGRVFRLPLFPDFVKGVTRFRGRLIPLVDLRLKLGLPEAAHNSRMCAVEIDVSIPMAIEVDSVERVRHFSEGEIVPPESFGMGVGPASWARRSQAVIGIVPFENRFCVLLDLEWILLGRSSRSAGKEANSLRPSVGRTQQQDTWNKEALTSSEYADIPKSIDLTLLGLMNPNTTDDASFQTEQIIHPLLRFDPGQWEPSKRRPDPKIASDRVCDERLINLLAKPVIVGRRRYPGFRPGDPRLSALAVALLKMPPTFQTKHAAPAVAELLGSSSDVYRVSHFRYDLAKLRVRHLAERIGTRCHYRLTKIGRVVCETLKNGSAAAALPGGRFAELLQIQTSALSA